MLYDDLRELASRQLKFGHDETLNPTAVVHELFEKLDGVEDIKASDRAHFFRIASQAMRHILINYAKEQGRRKRGGNIPDIRIDDRTEIGMLVSSQADQLLDLDSAFTRLEATDERLGQIAEMHFYGGLTYEEIAGALGVSRSTVARDWKMAKVLLREMLAS